MEITINWVHILQVFGLLGGIATVFGFFLAPMLYLGAKIDALKDHLHTEVKSLKEDMHKESKDFHGRLCALEEKYQSVKKHS